MALTVRRAGPRDAPALAALAERTFREAYAAVTAPDDLERHVADSFGPARQAAELGSPGVAVFLAEEEGRAVGYVQLRVSEPPACVRGSRPVQLWRCYVAAAWHGRGAAQLLVAEARRDAARRAAGSLWLTVWEQADRARAFYRKAGFVDVGDTVFLVGSDHQRDRVMECPVTPERTS